MPTKVAIVTGGNKGIGFAIVRGLAKKFDGDVFLTARSTEKGLSAAAKLTEKEKLKVQFHQLDIGDNSSIEKLRDFMKEKYGGIDILVNNAGIAFKSDEHVWSQGCKTESFGVQAEITIKTNYFSVKDTCDILFPILNPGARVINMSSSAGWLGDRFPNTNPELKAKFASSGSTLTVHELDRLMEDFMAAAKAGDHKEKGWPSSTYVISKIGLSALSRIQQQEFDKKPELDLVVNHVHPGFVNTDMTSHIGHMTIDEGAKSSLFAALLPSKTEIRGKYLWHNCSEKDWVNGMRLPSD